MLPSDLIAIDPKVEPWAGRDEVLSRSRQFTEAGRKLVRLEFPRTEFQVLGNAVVLYTLYECEMEQHGQRSMTAGRGTEVFVRRGDVSSLNTNHVQWSPPSIG